jgi:photosystem II stability/assembly factor-like uncharacterized protein
MHHGGMGVIRALVAALLVAVVASSGSPHAEAAPAAWQPAPDWEPTALAGRVTELFTPASGAFYAVQRRVGAQEISPSDGVYRNEGLWRSDDAGDSWRLVSLPPHAENVWVDPTDHSIIYAHASPRLYKTTDGGETWSPLVLTPFPQTDSAVHVGIVALSPADHQVLYARAWNGAMSLLLRSRDGGLTWESTTQETGHSPFTTAFVQPHVIDPARVLRVAGRYRHGSFIAGVDASDDQATTWEHHGQPGIDGLFTEITGLVGFGGIRPERLYVTTRSREAVGPGRAPRPIGGSIFRSDDEGRTWTQVLSTVQPGEEERLPSITGLAYDPGDPDVVYVAMGTGVQRSRDAGRTWLGLGRQDLPRISALALGIDGRYLYAATDAGVFRLNLPV